MMKKHERTDVILPETVERFRKAKGLTLPALADLADVDIKTLRRWLKGEPAFLSNIKTLADKLGTDPRALTIKLPPTRSTFDINVNIRGSFETPDGAVALASLTPTVLAVLQAAGIRIETHSTSLVIAEELTRTIALFYGLLDCEPFWVYVAIRPSQLEACMAAHKNGTLNLHNFETFGEIIVSGDGLGPPDEIPVRIAEMYEVDPVPLLRAAEEAAKKKR